MPASAAQSPGAATQRCHVGRMRRGTLLAYTQPFLPTHSHCSLHTSRPPALGRRRRSAAAACPVPLSRPSPSQLPAMLPSGKPVSARLQGEGEPRAVADATPGTAPTPEQRSAIADRHEPSGDAPAGRWASVVFRVRCTWRARRAPSSPGAHRQAAHCAPGGSSPLCPNTGTPGTSILSAGYAGTTKGTIAGG